MKSEITTFMEGQLIISEVRKIRRKQPKVGTRKLCLHLQETGFKIGRDKLFNLLRQAKLLVKRKKRTPYTTYSNHWLKKYTNLFRGVQLTGSNQVFVSDITYLKYEKGFAYLSLITDAWSRKIVGWNVSLSLSAEGAIKALKMALKGVSHPEGLIHHSDRGIQYCCSDYVNELRKNHVLISMTEENHCYENAIAERVNGILKDEFLLGENLSSFEFVKELVTQSIRTYNTERKHMSLNYQTPESVHSG
jgi:transposase InsO family protein